MRSLEARRVLAPEACVRRGAEQFGLAESVADRLLAFFQNLGFARGS